jgi:hypothetical protein
MRAANPVRLSLTSLGKIRRASSYSTAVDSGVGVEPTSDRPLQPSATTTRRLRVGYFPNSNLPSVYPAGRSTVPTGWPLTRGNLGCHARTLIVPQRTPRRNTVRPVLYDPAAPRSLAVAGSAQQALMFYLVLHKCNNSKCRAKRSAGAIFSQGADSAPAPQSSCGTVASCGTIRAYELIRTRPEVAGSPSFPQTPTYLLRFDGSCRPNPGPMGVGYTLEEYSGFDAGPRWSAWGHRSAPGPTTSPSTRPAARPPPRPAARHVAADGRAERQPAPGQPTAGRYKVRDRTLARLHREAKMLLDCFHRPRRSATSGGRRTGQRTSYPGSLVERRPGSAPAARWPARAPAVASRRPERLVAQPRGAVERDPGPHLRRAGRPGRSSRGGEGVQGCQLPRVPCRPPRLRRVLRALHGQQE